MLVCAFEWFPGHGFRRSLNCLFFDCQAQVLVFEYHEPAFHQFEMHLLVGALVQLLGQSIPIIVATEHKVALSDADSESLSLIHITSIVFVRQKHCHEHVWLDVAVEELTRVFAFHVSFPEIVSELVKRVQGVLRFRDGVLGASAALGDDEISLSFLLNIEVLPIIIFLLLLNGLL